MDNQNIIAPNQGISFQKEIERMEVVVESHSMG
jgi:hypothetical protein